MSALGAEQAIRALRDTEVCGAAGWPLMEKPFVLYKRIESSDYYLCGWVPYCEDLHKTDEDDKPRPKVSPACNFVPSDESAEDDLPLQLPTKDQSQTSPQGGIDIRKFFGTSSSSSASDGSSSSGTSTKSSSSSACEIIEFGSLPKRGCYVDTVDEFIQTVQTLVRMGITCYKHPEDDEPLPVFMNKSVFSKEQLIVLKKQIKLELGIKITIKGFPGRPSTSGDYRKMQTITW